MPLKIEAILANTYDFEYCYAENFYVMVSGVTAGNRLSGAVRGLITDTSLNFSSVTAPQGYAIGSATSRALVPIIYDYSHAARWLLVDGSNANNFSWYGAGITAGIVITDTTTNETTVVSGPLFVTTVPSTWTITQDASKNCNITCTSMGSGGLTPFLITLNRSGYSNSANTQDTPSVFNIELSSPTGLSIFSSNITAPADGSLPFVQVPSATITTTGEHTVQIKIRHAYPSTLNTNIISILQTFYKYQIYPTVLTAPASATSPTGLYSWLTSDYWHLTDLQVNVATRDVASRRGAITVRPNDTVNFAILFNNGTAGVDPVATDIKLAVRNAANNGPYSFWSAATVSTVTVSGDVYYAITVTASDEDLLSAQAANLIAGANTSPSLLGEIQWTTTRGTFSSNTFTINTPNEVVRDQDI
jgi:hypothetical protein